MSPKDLTENLIPKMILETGNRGITLIEICLVLVIIGMLAFFSVFFPHKAISRKNLDNSAMFVCEILNTARMYATAEHKTFQVVFENNSCGIYRDDGTLIGKIYKLPRFIVIKEKTDGFSPAEFLPQGTAKQAGHLILEDTSTKKTKTIVLYNLTGKAVIK